MSPNVEDLAVQGCHRCRLLVEDIRLGRYTLMNAINIRQQTTRAASIAKADARLAKAKEGLAHNREYLLTHLDESH